jgi:hypothetical protein
MKLLKSKYSQMLTFWLLRALVIAILLVLATTVFNDMTDENDNMSVLVGFAGIIISIFSAIIILIESFITFISKQFKNK